MTEVFSITQLPLPPYQASPMKLDSEWTMPLSFETGLNFDSFNFEAALLDAEFSLDDIIVPDVLAISEPFGNVGDLSFPYDFGDVTGCGDLWDVPHSPSNCSLESNHSSTSIAIESGGFLRKFPTGARSRRVNGASRSCSRPSRSEYSTQSAHAAPPSHLQPCRCLENTPESTPIELAVTKLCWPPLELPSMELTRQQRVQRYREKRKRRTFAKTIRYEARRAYAEVRPRIKGRFATKEEAAAIRATRIPDGIQAPFMKTEG